jgi:hypothetical protein
MKDAKYIALFCFSSGSPSDREARVFTNIKSAKKHVESVAARLSRICDLKGSDEDYVESASIYRIYAHGTLKLVWEFDGHDRGDGKWDGWSIPNHKIESFGVRLIGILGGALAGQIKPPVTPY